MVMKIHKDDTVKIITGKDKGKTGKVLKIFTEKTKVVVEGVNIVKRHVKPGAITKEGGIISIERPIHLSNVMVIDAKEAAPTKVETQKVEGKKYRVSKKTKDVIAK
jgi:large subunit ribosomal protein L24